MRRSALVTGIALTSILSAEVTAQTLPSQLEYSTLVVIDRVVRDRWVHEGQHSGFVPFESVRDFIQTRGWGTRRSDRRTLTLQIGYTEARLSTDETGRMTRIQIDRPDLFYRADQNASSRAESRRRRLIGRGATLALPAARFWEVAYVRPTEHLRPGMTWTDTLHFVADPGEGFSQQLDGVWENRVVGDTAIDGRTLPVVRFEAEVRYRSVHLVDDAAMEGDFVIDRDVSGTIVGTAVVDTVKGIRYAGADTARWSGVAVLNTPDGRSYRSPVRYERFQTWTARDSTTWIAIQDSLRAERRRGPRGGGTRFPGTELEERLSGGDPALTDSLLLEWRSSNDPNQRRDIEQTLRLWAGGGQRLEDRLRAFRTELGDTASVITEMLSIGARSLTEARLDRVLPYLEDLGKLWNLGITPRWTYVSLAERIMSATPTLEPDSSRWACDPAACARLVELAETAVEPRLRDVGMVIASMRDPAHWYERLRSRSDSGATIVEPALQLSNGSWLFGIDQASSGPMPEEGASWRTWLAWMGEPGRHQSDYRGAMRMYHARTGRDVVAELRSAWPPKGDSAQLVIGTLLRGMGVLEPLTAAEMADALRSGSAARIQGARSQFGGRHPEATPAPTEQALDFLRLLLASLLGSGNSPWSAHRTYQPGSDRNLNLGSLEARTVPVFLMSDSLPPELGADLDDGVQLIELAAWRERPLRAGGVLLQLGPVRTVGPFVSLQWNRSSRSERSADEAPRGGFVGGLLWLLRTNDIWEVVWFLRFAS